MLFSVIFIKNIVEERPVITPKKTGTVGGVNPAVKKVFKHANAFKIRGVKAYGVIAKICRKIIKLVVFTLMHLYSWKRKRNTIFTKFMPAAVIQVQLKTGCNGINRSIGVYYIKPKWIV